MRVSGIVNKGGTVLLVLTRAGVWTCPSFELRENEDPKMILASGMAAYGISAMVDNIVYDVPGKNMFLGISNFSGKAQKPDFVSDMRWFDTQRLNVFDISVDSKFAILEHERKNRKI